MYQTGAGVTSFTAVGTSGYALISGGTSAPTWQNVTSANTANAIVSRDSSGNFSVGTITGALNGNASTASSATSATTSTNVAGGAAGSMFYQSGASTTASIPAGTSGQILASNGTGSPYWLNQSSIAAGSAATATNATNATNATTAGTCTGNAATASAPYSGSTLNAVTAKAWVYFDGTTSTPTIKGTYNVSSITKNGSGDYTINYTSALANANYTVTGTRGSSTSNQSFSGIIACDETTPRSTTSCRVTASFVSSVANRTNADEAYISVVII